MKTLLNIIIAVLILFIWSDIEKNANRNQLDYSNSFYCLPFVLIFFYLRYYWDEVLTYLNK